MGIQLNEKCRYTLLFADDKVLATDEEDIYYMLRKLIEEYNKCGLNLNMRKTEYLGTRGQ